MAEKKHAHHGFHTTTIRHHSDGSATVHHQHHEGAHKDVEHAAADLDGVHDSLQDHLGVSNVGAAAADAGQHGVPEPQASAAGLPPGTGGAPAAV